VVATLQRRATDRPAGRRIDRRDADRLRFGRFHGRQDAAGKDNRCDRVNHRPRCAEPDAPPPPDPCAVNLAAPTIAKVVSELPRDPRSAQPWNPEPLAGNYNECAQLSAVIVKANTNADNATTRAVMFHLGKYIPQGVPDTFGFNGIDTSQCTGDTVALTYPSGISGLGSAVKFRWNGNGVELIGNTGG
jgi:hypothetical protein